MRSSQSMKSSRKEMSPQRQLPKIDNMILFFIFVLLHKYGNIAAALRALTYPRKTIILHDNYLDNIKLQKIKPIVKSILIRFNNMDYKCRNIVFYRFTINLAMNGDSQIKVFFKDVFSTLCIARARTAYSAPIRRA